MQLGHDLGGADLIDQYSLEVEECVFKLAKEEKTWDAYLDEVNKEGGQEQVQKRLQEVSTKREMLQAGRSFLEKGLGSKQAQAYQKQQLLNFCEVVERKPDLVFPMSEAGE